MRNELAAIKAQTGKPFNVNFFCHTPPTPNPSAKRFGELRFRRITKSMELMQRRFRSGRDVRPSVPKPPMCWRIQARCGELSFWFAFGRIAGARESWGAKISVRQRPSKRRVGSKRMGSMPSLRKVSRRADIVACSCRKI